MNMLDLPHPFLRLISLLPLKRSIPYHWWNGKVIMWVLCIPLHSWHGYLIGIGQVNNDASDHITFLPWKSLFDPVNCNCWASLTHNIQDWLINVVDTQSQEGVWGCKLFWMAFMAACSTFPQGPWPYWHPRISVEGAFIQHWLNRAEPQVQRCFNSLQGPLGAVSPSGLSLSPMWSVDTGSEASKVLYCNILHCFIGNICLITASFMLSQQTCSYRVHWYQKSFIWHDLYKPWRSDPHPMLITQGLTTFSQKLHLGLIPTPS